MAHGCRGVAFDFSGHGESAGKLRELSLRRRFEQAVAAIDAYSGADGPLVVVGFSMSGQMVADLFRHYGDRVTQPQIISSISVLLSREDTIGGVVRAGQQMPRHRQAVSGRRDGAGLAVALTGLAVRTQEGLGLQA